MLRKLVTASLLAAALWPCAAAQAQTKLLRFPDIHRDIVVFVYAGDLWKAPAAGGTAIRLTSHPGLELFPRVSPDGKWIAFTGQYDGDEQVYVIPARGGEPRQLTYYPSRGPLPPRWGYDHQVYGFTPDSKRVLFRSFRDTWDISDSRLYTVSVDGGPAEALPMPNAGAGDLSGDGKRIVYAPLARDFRSEKRYQGGWATDLYLFDLESKTATQLTSHVRSDRDPMWINDKLYFTSDRDGTFNLYAQELRADAAPTQLTTSKQWDVRWPSADSVAGKIVFEQGGELGVFDVASGKATMISIYVPDDGVHRRPETIKVGDQIEDATLSPKGERVLFAARGDLFSVPAEKGPVRNLTRSSNAHDRLPAWSPDGAKIAYVSDRSGEEQIWLVAQDGASAPEQLTTTLKGRLYQPVWSPDGKHLAFSDQQGKVYVLSVADKKLTEAADDPRGRIFDLAWSPKGSFLAFSLSDIRNYRSVYLWEAATGKLHRATQGFFNEYGPAWDPEGGYLYYLSERTFVPQLDLREWNYANDRQTQIFALALQKDGKHPFPAQSDEVTIEKKEEKAAEPAPEPAKDAKGKAAAKGKAKAEEKPAEAKPEGDKIDLEGLAGRFAPVPLPGENYVALFAKKGHLLYARTPAFYYGREGVGDVTLWVYSLESREEKQLVDGLADADLSFDGSKLLVSSGGSWSLMDAAPGGEGSKKPVSTGGLEVNRIPQEEWATIFDEVWRRFRDFFYVENMHGYDWEALRQQYKSLLPHVAHRGDLNYVIHEMISELAISHAYIDGGDLGLPDRTPVGLLGARLELDAAAGRYRIAHIYAGDNAEGRYRSPLTEVGVDAKVGDYLLAVDGVELSPNEDPYRAFRNKVRNPIELTLNSQPSPTGARKVMVRPINDEQGLVYLQWVTGNLERVRKASNGRLGYLHIPDMGPDGIREFTKWYYPQVEKEGLIVDARGNGGGNVSQMIIERLSRRLLGTDFRRGDQYAGTYPNVSFYGHMACLLSQTSASDGDIFPYMFRQAGLGPLIGKRSWGGVVGITDHGPLLDGGVTNVPEFASASLDGQYIIEAYGVDPDIEVDNRPEDLLAGRDPQLERAVAEVLKKVDAEPRKLPAKPADPVRNRERFDLPPRLQKN